MRKTTALATLLAVIMMVAAPATAAPREEVTFAGPSYFNGSGEFTTIGGHGLVCPQGTISNLKSTTSPKNGESPNRVNMQIHKKFVCDDGLGTFVIKLQVHIPVQIDENNWPTFNWVIVDGTGEYMQLKGNGSGFAAGPIFGDDPWPIGVFDVYQGQIHAPGS
jgi:hypothetical protein